MRFIQVVRTAACALIAAAVAATTVVTPAYALSSRPRSAPTFNGSVYAIAYRGSTVYVGGAFTTAVSGGRTYSRQRLAAFDARSGALLNWSPAADRTVRALAVSGNGIFAGGDFAYINGLRRDALARVDAVTGRVSAFAHRISGAPYSLAVGNGLLYAGGSFTEVDGDRRANLAAFSLTSGRLDSGWRPYADGTVHAVTASGGKVYVGGAFHRINGVDGTLRIAAIDGEGGSVYRGFRPGSPAQVNAIATDGNGVYAATGGQGGRAVAWSPRGSLRWQRLFDGDAVAIASLGGVTYVGGHFDRACLTLANGDRGTCSDASVSRVKLAAINRNGSLTTWAPQANGVIGVRVLAVDRSRSALGAGGDFTMVGGKARKRFASFS